MDKQERNQQKERLKKWLAKQFGEPISVMKDRDIEDLQINLKLKA